MHTSATTQAKHTSHLIHPCLDQFVSIPMHRKLESNWKTIRDEALAIMDEKTGGFVPEEENLREKGSWLQFTLYLQGRKLRNNCIKTPKTCAIMDSIPESIGCKRGQVKIQGSICNVSFGVLMVS